MAIVVDSCSHNTGGQFYSLYPLLVPLFIGMVLQQILSPERVFCNQIMKTIFAVKSKEVDVNK